MAVSEIMISGYRSIRKLRLPLDPVTVVTGHNGAGKSNLYRALSLIHAASLGTLARTLVREGGMPAVLWAGPRTKGVVRMKLGVTREDWSYELACGLPTPGPPTRFQLDPEVKEEAVWHGDRRRRGTTVLERDHGAVTVCDEGGRRVSYTGTLLVRESVLSQIQEPSLYPELYVLLQQFRGWRFYHDFRTDEDSPLRQPQMATRTPILAADGSDLMSCLQTIAESDRGERLLASLREAFPRSWVQIGQEDQSKRLVLRMKVDGIDRLFEAAELSDGTLRYLCLVAALLSPEPPELLVLNEPDVSLHPDLLEPLARLIVEASADTQICLTTHSDRLATLLQEQTGTSPVRLYMENGETLVDGQGLLDRA